MSMVDEQKERRDAALKKYADLKARAEHPNTPKAEADVAYKMAAKVMADWEIDELELVAASGATPAIVVGMVRLGDPPKQGKGDSLMDEKIGLGHTIAEAFGCEICIVTHHFGTADEKTGDARIAGIYMEAIGYSHDVAMVRALTYSTNIEMAAALLGEKQKAANYQQEFGRAFIQRIGERVVDEITRARESRIKDGVSSGTALAIRDQKAMVKDFFDELHPPKTLGSRRARNTRYDPAARERGRKAANSADLSTGQRIAGSSAKPVSGPRKGLNK
jgi:hypothetical protein